MTRFFVLCGLVLAMALAIACSGGAVDTSTPAASEAVAPAKDAIAKTTENGPVKATVKVWPPKPTLGDAIYLRLEVDAPAGISIDAPFQEAGDSRLGRFHVVAFTRDTERKSDGGQLLVETYTLDAPTSGKHRVPPLRLEMIDARTSEKDHRKPQEILTEEVPIEIAAIKSESANAELKPAIGELDPDVGGTSWVVIIGVLSITAVLISGTILAMGALRTRRRIQKQRSAYDEAVAHLHALEERGAPDAEAADEWFVELSAIVRRYLEKRYEIRAPELTTEEFLQVATARPELGDEHRTLLTQFLERCDRVKFAGYRPDADESLATLSAARGFIEDTRLRDHAPAAAGKAAA